MGVGEIFSLGSLASDHWLRIFGLGSLAVGVGGIFSLGSLA